MYEPSVEKFNQFRDEPAPTKWVICSRCRGEGTLGGYPGVYSEEDFVEDPDFYEDYMNHRRTCEDCGGPGKVRVFDEEAAGPELTAEYQEYERDSWETEAIHRAEVRMGA